MSVCFYEVRISGHLTVRNGLSSATSSMATTISFELVWKTRSLFHIVISTDISLRYSMDISNVEAEVGLAVMKCMYI